MWRALGYLKKQHDEVSVEARAAGWGTFLACALMNPAVLGLAAAAAGTVAAADGASWLTGKALAAARQKREELARKRAEAEARVRAAEAAERAREEEARKPKPPTRTQVRQALRELYFDLLEEIAADPLLDDHEKAAARERAKQKYLKRLDEVL